MRRLLSTALLCAALMACDDDADSPEMPARTEPDPSTGRWYSPEQQRLGGQLFRQHCAQCHGDQAQGLAEDWRQRLADGSYPPPPLNGSAHTWHHPLPVLLQVIGAGGIALGGNMPAFDDVLNERDKLAVIAYFQSLWSDDIYANWQQMGGSN